MYIVMEYYWITDRAACISWSSVADSTHTKKNARDRPLYAQNVCARVQRARCKLNQFHKFIMENVRVSNAAALFKYVRWFARPYTNIDTGPRGALNTVRFIASTAAAPSISPSQHKSANRWKNGRAYTHIIARIMFSCALETNKFV